MNLRDDAAVQSPKRLRHLFFASIAVALMMRLAACGVPGLPGGDGGNGGGGGGGGGGSPSPSASPTGSASPTPTPTAGPTPPSSPSPSPSPSPTPPPVIITCAIDSDCTDGVFCNGVEVCIQTSCTPGDPPCDELTETCNESTDTCQLIVAGCVSDADCEASQRCDTVTGNCIDVGAAACGEGAGNCFIANFSPGCESAECCQLVCSFNTECCFISWSQECVDLAFGLCSP